LKKMEVKKVGERQGIVDVKGRTGWRVGTDITKK